MIKYQKLVFYSLLSLNTKGIIFEYGNTLRNDTDERASNIFQQVP